MKYRCKICGQIVEVKEGENCPICGADFGMLELLDEALYRAKQTRNTISF